MNPNDSYTTELSEKRHKRYLVYFWVRIILEVAFIACVIYNIVHLFKEKYSGGYDDIALMFYFALIIASIFWTVYSSIRIRELLSGRYPNLFYIRGFLIVPLAVVITCALVSIIFLLFFSYDFKYFEGVFIIIFFYVGPCYLITLIPHMIFNYIFLIGDGIRFKKKLQNENSSIPTDDSEQFDS